MISYSQYGQDIYCFKNFFKGKTRGTFLEIGADDGVDKSNTLFYENLGWKGLCVEPSPSRFIKLRENRKCFCENCAVWSQRKVVKFMDISGWGKGLSGIIDQYDPKHVERIRNELRHPENRGYKIIDVPCVTPDELLGKYDLYHVDFCSIDTEGGELSILQSIDMDRFDFSVICVENNYRSNAISEFMTSIGFEMLARLNIDEVYRQSGMK